MTTPSDRARERLVAGGYGDDQLRELIRQRLTEDPALDATDVSLEVRDGRVTLAGTVASARVSSEIEQTVENCGALEVDNQLRVLV
jgi:osmotically-inducible protein OsmY